MIQPFANLRGASLHTLFSPFRYTINLHTDQIAGWLKCLNQEVNLTAVRQLTDQLQQQGCLGLVAPQFSQHIYKIHPLLTHYLKQTYRQQDEQAIRTAFHDYYQWIAESLYQLLQSDTDTDRQNARELIHWEYFSLRQALFWALDDNKHFANYFSVLFTFLSEAGRLDECLQLTKACLRYYQEDIMLSLSPEKRLEWADVLDALGHTLLEKKAIRQAGNFYRQIEAIYENKPVLHQLTKEVASLYQQLGTIETELRNYPKAEIYLNAARSFFEAQNDQLSLATTNRRLARLHYETGSYALALDELDTALEWASTANELPVLLNLWQVKAGVLFQLQRYEESQELYEKCKTLGQALRQPFSIAKAWHGLGLLASTRQQCETGFSCCCKALEVYLALPTNFAFDIAQLYTNMGNDCYHLQRYSESEEYYLRAYPVFKRLQLPVQVAEVTQSLANVCYYLEKIPESLQYDAEALTLFAELDRRANVLEILENAINLSQELDTKQPIENAMAVLLGKYSKETCEEMLQQVMNKE
ncbi:MAG: tetratricopeptide repeat protein [Saprospiraceae bacterium]|nr:tetratricopeptide repeat protein [Saprospiraceae bacterium]